jgi:hypothetical protein
MGRMHPRAHAMDISKKFLERGYLATSIGSQQDLRVFAGMRVLGAKLTLALKG